jgi:hypothetical protein
MTGDKRDRFTPRPALSPPVPAKRAKRLNVDMPEDEYLALRQWALEKGVTVSTLVVSALEVGLERWKNDPEFRARFQAELARIDEERRGGRP